MTNQEAFKLCLDERISKREELSKELDKITVSYEKALREEHMYHHLTSGMGTRYQNMFNEKHQCSQENVDKLSNEKETLEKELRILQIEIDYLETQVQVN